MKSRGEANVKRWTQEIMPLLTKKDPLGVMTFATHHVSIDQAEDYYRLFNEQKYGVIKVVLKPFGEI